MKIYANEHHIYVYVYSIYMHLKELNATSFLVSFTWEKNNCIATVMHFIELFSCAFGILPLVIVPTGRSFKY